MMKDITAKTIPELTLEKCQTGIQGFDEITFGGLPRGRPCLVCGGPGCGKTLFAMEFLVRGANQFNEQGVFLSFEEKSEELIQNFSSLGFQLQQLIERKKILIDHVFIERGEIEETGEYDLDGLFIRLESAIDSIGAKRVVLDTTEALFAGLRNETILRAELRRLFRWLKTKGMTAIITGERGDHSLTKYGLEEYVADCVIFLDNRVNEQTATRRLKIIKYRGSKHGTNEYPFLIGTSGISVLPITSLGLNYAVPTGHISSGIKSLDSMLDQKGYYKGSTVLFSGAAGTGKTSYAAHLINGACSQGHRCLYFAFEESQNQIIRNMRSIGINLQQWVDKGLLIFSTYRPTYYGLEQHLVNTHSLINEIKPGFVVIDSITNLISTGTVIEVKSMLTRLLDYLKMNQITTLITDLSTYEETKRTEIGISSLSDTWLRLENIEKNNEQIRMIRIIKSRGMNHSNAIKEFIITGKGIEIKERK